MSMEYMIRHFKEGFLNFKRNGWMTVSAISSLTFMLLIVGVSLVVLLNLNHMTNKIENNVEARLYLHDSSEQAIGELTEELQLIKQVDTINFISKDEGLNNFIDTFGDGEAFESLKEDNPLNNVLVIKTKKPQDLTVVVKKIKKFSLVDKVEYGEEFVKPLFKMTSIARTFGFIFIVSFVLIAIHIVANTIKITVLSRKEEIKLRKLLGATDQFVRIPFFIEGSLIGVLGTLLPIIVLSISYPFIYNQIPNMNTAFLEFISPGVLLPLLSLFLLGLGIFIGIWGAVPSLRKLLKV